MRVVHLSKNDIGGGAARAAFRLHTEMLNIGIDSKMFVLNKEKLGDDNIQSVTTLNKRIFSLIRDFVNVAFSSFANKSKWIFSFDLIGVNTSKYLALKIADVIYVHWVNGGFMTIKNIEELLRLNKQVVFILHDMWSLTGGCHYSFECIQYSENSCRDCPLMESRSRKYFPRFFYKKKAEIFTKYKNYQIVTPSKWLGDCARKVPYFSNTKISVIPNPLDYNIFKPSSKKGARSILNIDIDTKLILFVADLGTENPYKGWKFLEEALLKLSAESQYEIQVMVLGCDRNLELEKLLPYKIHFTGRLFDEYSLSLVYNAADVFVTPSLADNLPSTVLESISCGTPVVGFRVGGIPDMIKHQENGYLANYKSVDDLVKGIIFSFENLHNVSLDPYFDTHRILNLYKQLTSDIEKF